MEFIPRKFVDPKKVSAEQLLSPEQIRRMDSEASNKIKQIHLR